MSVAFSFGAEQDIVMVDERSPCSRLAQTDGAMSCFRASGSQYHGTPLRSSSVRGPVLATTRLVAGIDVELAHRFWIGARAGGTVRGLGPRAEGAEVPNVFPWALELRGTNEVVLRSPIRLLLFYRGGLAHTDARMYVEIEEDRSVPPSRYQLEQPDYQRLVAYKRLGTGFVGGGVGLAMNVIPHIDVRVDLGARVTFPTFGFAWTPALSVEVRP